AGIRVEQVAVPAEVRGDVCGLALEGGETSGLFAEARVELGCGPEGCRRPGEGILVQGRHRFMAELRETRCMPDRRALGAQLLILARMRVRGSQLLELPAQVLLL